MKRTSQTRLFTVLAAVVREQLVRVSSVSRGLSQSIADNVASPTSLFALFAWDSDAIPVPRRFAQLGTLSQTGIQRQQPYIIPRPASSAASLRHHHHESRPEARCSDCLLDTSASSKGTTRANPSWMAGKRNPDSRCGLGATSYG